MDDDSPRIIEYQSSSHRSGSPRLIRAGASAAVAADIALLAAVFIWNGGRIWGPYLNPPVTVNWAHPIAEGSLVLGVIGLFASGVGLVRSSAVGWGVVAATASAAFLVGAVCVVIFGLL
jgi:hypothetical protein